MGTKQAVVETWRNLTAVGADPLAITDNLNFANPERPEVMGQLVGAIKGMGEACRVLDYPVVSGNVSLYNETNGVGIPPTPAIGAVGLIPDIAHMADLRLKREGDLLIVIGREAGHLGQSLYQELVDRQARRRAAARRSRRRDQGRPPRARADPRGQGLGRARRLRRRAAGRHRRDGARRLRSAWSSSPTRASCRRTPSGSARTRAATCSPSTPCAPRRCWSAPACWRCRPASSARTGGDAIALKGEPALPLAELSAAHEAWLPQFMAADLRFPSCS